MKKGITFGAFDLFHAGHVMMLQEAKKQWLNKSSHETPSNIKKG